MNEIIRFVLNGQPRRLAADGNRKLLPVLRSDFDLTGTKSGCGEGLCGACTVLVDGKAARSCITTLNEVEGKEITTIEGLAEKERLHPVQEAFMHHNALQCGFCTPGMILSAFDLLRRNPDPSREEIIETLEYNLCRCGAHTRIIEAVLETARRMRSGGSR